MRKNTKESPRIDLNSRPLVEILAPLAARIFCLLEDRVLDKKAWVATLLGTHFRIQDHKKVKFPGQMFRS